MTQVQQMAALVQRAAFEEISDEAKHHLIEYALPMAHKIAALACP